MSSGIQSLAVVLFSVPTIGGAFAYSEAVVRALALGRPEQTVVHAVCLNPEWGKLAARLGLPVTECREYPVPIRKLRRLLLLTGNVALWRLLAPNLSPIHRTLSRLKVDLALFPCEPHLCLDSPMPALAPIHDLMYHYEAQFPEVGAWRKRHARRILDGLVLKQAARVLVDSDVGADQVAELFPGYEGKPFRLPYISMRQPPANGGGPDPLPTEIPEKFLFYPAQFWLHKNHLGLIGAVERLKREGLRVHVVCCGSDKNSRAEVVTRLREAGLTDQFTLLGFVPDELLCRLYQRACGLIMPTFFGPTNIPPLEAMQLGCPVAVSGIYGMREQLGDAALYFDPRDPADIARTVRSLWTDESVRRRLIAAGHLRAAAGSLDAFARGLWDACGQVGRPGPSSATAPPAFRPHAATAGTHDSINFNGP